MEIFFLAMLVIGVVLYIVAQFCARLIGYSSWESAIFSTKLDVVSWGEGYKYGCAYVRGELLTTHRCWLWPSLKKQQTVFFLRTSVNSPTITLADGELPALRQEIERQLVAYHDAKDKEQERMDRIESRKAIVASVSKSKRNV